MEPRTDLVPVQLEQGRTIKIMATHLGGEEDIAAFDKLLPFTEVTQSIECIAASLEKVLERVGPNKASVEFGVEVGMETGQLVTLITKGTATGNLKITLEWTKKPEKAEK